MTAAKKWTQLVSVCKTQYGQPLTQAWMERWAPSTVGPHRLAHPQFLADDAYVSAHSSREVGRRKQMERRVPHTGQPRDKHSKILEGHQQEPVSVTLPHTSRHQIITTRCKEKKARYVLF